MDKENESLRLWLEGAIQAWERKWKDHPADHRYKFDVAAFIGEKLLTDFNLRDTKGLQDCERAAVKSRDTANRVNG